MSLKCWNYNIVTVISQRFKNHRFCVISRLMSVSAVQSPIVLFNFDKCVMTVLLILVDGSVKTTLIFDSCLFIIGSTEKRYIREFVNNKFQSTQV